MHYLFLNWSLFEAHPDTPTLLPTNPPTHRVHTMHTHSSHQFLQDVSSLHPSNASPGFLSITGKMCNDAGRKVAHIYVFGVQQASVNSIFVTHTTSAHDGNVGDLHSTVYNATECSLHLQGGEDYKKKH